MFAYELSLELQCAKYCAVVSLLQLVCSPTWPLYLAFGGCEMVQMVALFVAIKIGLLFCRLRSSLWLQFKPHQIAAGAAYLAAKFLNMDLASYHNVWKEFHTPPSVLKGTTKLFVTISPLDIFPGIPCFLRPFYHNLRCGMLLRTFRLHFVSILLFVNYVVMDVVHLGIIFVRLYPLRYNRVKFLLYIMGNILHDIL